MFKLGFGIEPMSLYALIIAIDSVVSDSAVRLFLVRDCAVWSSLHLYSSS